MMSERPSGTDPGGEEPEKGTVEGALGWLIWQHQQRSGKPAPTWTAFSRLAAGAAAMYMTALLIAA